MTRTTPAMPLLAAETLAEEIANRYAEPPRADSGLPDWWPQSLAHGSAGTALLHIERAATGRAEWSRARAWLAYATSSELSIGSNASLYYGAPAVEFALRAATPHLPGLAARTLPTLKRATDQVIRRRLDEARQRLQRGTHPPLAEFDIIRGMSGFGALLLRREDPTDALLGDILAYLVALTEPVQDGDDLLPGWWTELAPNGKASDNFPGGHANNGLAHGIGGVLAMLALALRRGAAVDGHAEAIERIWAWLDRWRRESDHGPWWPYWITRAQLHGKRENAGGPRRPSWCYGTLGLARAQQLAALALDDPIRRAMAEGAAAAALADPAQLRQTEDASLCHGYAGLIHIAGLMATDSLVPSVLTDVVPDLFDALIQKLARPAPADPGWLEGQVGTALALHSLAVRPVTGWDHALLIT
ncbi:MAG: lanthionine synthetase C family protein [Pseudonocardiaceae bacterium]